MSFGIALLIAAEKAAAKPELCRRCRKAPSLPYQAGCTACVDLCHESDSFLHSCALCRE